jgi:hypothetical protein
LIDWFVYLNFLIERYFITRAVKASRSQHKQAQPSSCMQPSSCSQAQPSPHSQAHLAKPMQPIPHSWAHAAEPTKQSPRSQAHNASPTKPIPCCQAHPAWFFFTWMFPMSKLWQSNAASW